MLNLSIRNSSGNIKTAIKEVIVIMVVVIIHFIIIIYHTHHQNQIDENMLKLEQIQDKNSAEFKELFADIAKKKTFFETYYMIIIEVFVVIGIIIAEGFMVYESKNERQMYKQQLREKLL